MPITRYVPAVGLIAILVGSCATARPPQAPAQPSGKVPIAELWAEPEGERDLYYGVGGERLLPDPRREFRVIEIKVRGFSQGYTVLDDAGREWSTKLPPEAAVEVAMSRIHWGIGYHQPPIYLIHEWNARGALAPNPQLPARFREKSPDLHGLESGDSWAFDDNPFIGTRPLAGLMVLQALIENQDIKASNNTTYTLKSPAEGATKWYVVRDLGYSLGRAGFNGPRGDIESFERGRFITGVVDGKVRFDYGGRHKALLQNISVADVRWLCERLNRLTERQWKDAFRAGGFEDARAERFIAVIKKRIGEGLALQ